MICHCCFLTRMRQNIENKENPARFVSVVTNRECHNTKQAKGLPLDLLLLFLKENAKYIEDKRTPLTPTPCCYDNQVISSRFSLNRDFDSSFQMFQLVSACFSSFQLVLTSINYVLSLGRCGCQGTGRTFAKAAKTMP